MVVLIMSIPEPTIKIQCCCIIIIMSSQTTIHTVMNFFNIQEKGMLFRKEWSDQPTTMEGKACSVLNMASFTGDILAFIISGPVISLFGTSNAIMMVTCLAGAVAILCSSFIKIPDRTR